MPDNPIEQPDKRDLQREFMTAFEEDGVARKYAESKDERTQERIEQWYRLRTDLKERFDREISQRADIVQEMQQMNEELADALTRRTHNRKLTRPNRFDTPEEQEEVRRESADYHRYLAEQKDTRTSERETRERASRADEEQFDALGLEIPWRLARAGGSEQTTIGAVERLMPHIDLVKRVKSDDLLKYFSELDQQMEKSKTSPASREAMEKLKKALK